MINLYLYTIFCIIMNMKVTRPLIGLALHIMMKNVKKQAKLQPPHGKVKEFLDVPFINDGNENHKYDVYVAGEDRKNICFIDIHGGAYMYGNHKNNYAYALEFNKRGYDFINVDYEVIKNDRNLKDLVDDVICNIKHVADHLKDYGLENDKFIITGDSAGGHFALLISECFDNEEVAKKLGYEMPKIEVVGCVVNCPVYDVKDIGEDVMTKGARIRMFGKKCLDKDYMALLSPRTYIKDYRMPLFLSTCKNDFIRVQSLILNEDMKSKDNKYVFHDINSDKKEVGHVHNVMALNLEESKFINDEIDKFVSSLII